MMRKIFIIFFLLISLFVVNAAYAGIHTGPLVPCGGSNQPACDLCHFWQLGSNIINFISFNLAIPAATALFVTAGILFLVSGGNEGRVTLARTIFINTVVGLAIIFCSWLLVDSFLKTVASRTTATGIRIMFSWNYFPQCSEAERLDW